MEHKLIKTMKLKNGLDLDFYDMSRKLAGDRWYVGFVARIDIALTDSLSESQQLSDYSIDKIRAGLGETVSYQQERKRYFIDEDEKDALLLSLMDSFIETTLDYFSHPDFPGKYVVKEFKAYLKRQTWYPDDAVGGPITLQNRGNSTNEDSPL